jgi:hypothetical protein
MNLEKKKELALDQDINSLMDRMGYQPFKQTQYEVWYLSPFRPGESQPSFHVSKGSFVKSVWNDFGKGGRTGGNIIHLVRELKGLGYKDAIDYILDYTVGNRYETRFSDDSRRLKQNPIPKSERHILENARDLEHSALFAYLTQERSLTKEVAAKYLKQVHFKDTQTGRHFFAPGIPNLKGGFEINNQVNGCKFKAPVPSSSKSMSFIEGGKPHREVLVFEGFLDALSFLVYFKRNEFPSSCLILNSASMEQEAFAFIREQGYSLVKGFFDHDDRGQELNLSFSINFGDDFQDMSQIYFGYKDFNAFLQLSKSVQTGLDFNSS